MRLETTRGDGVLAVVTTDCAKHPSMFATTIEVESPDLVDLFGPDRMLKLRRIGVLSLDGCCVRSEHDAAKAHAAVVNAVDAALLVNLTAPAADAGEGVEGSES